MKEREILNIVKPKSYTKDDLPLSGIIFSLKTKSLRDKYFQKFERRDKCFLFTSERGKFELITNITKNSDVRNLFRNNIVMMSKNLQQDKRMTKEQLELDYFGLKTF